MSSDTFVQVEVPRTGQKIRNLSITAVQADGTIATVLMQVVALADAQGNLLDLSALDGLSALLTVAREQRGLLKLLVGAFDMKMDGVALDEL